MTAISPPLEVGSHFSLAELQHPRQKARQELGQIPKKATEPGKAQRLKGIQEMLFPLYLLFVEKISDTCR